jgi:hypothetical protein
MQDNYYILVTSTNLLLLCQCKSDNFPVNVSYPTLILYGSSVEWSTVAADVAFIEKYIKEFQNILSLKKFRELIILSLLCDICSFIICKYSYITSE